MILNDVPVVPETENSSTFHQGMVNRMGVSFFKYGKVEDAYPNRVDAIRSLITRLEKYTGDLQLAKEGGCGLGGDGNTEWLMDVANFAMIEFMRPRHPGAHFKGTDSDASPGRSRLDGAGAHDRNDGSKHE
jgi:hypothetical protein